MKPTQDKHYDYTFKLLLIGDANAGKSSLLLKLANTNPYDTFVTTIGLDFKTRTITLDNKKIRLQIWDTAGQERFKTITNTFYKGAHGVMVVYNVDDRQSFTDINNWLVEIKKHASEDVSNILIGNKCDLDTQRQVSYDEGRAYADNVGIEFMETSAKDETNVESALIMIVKDLKAKAEAKEMKINREPENKKADVNLSIKVLGKKKQSGCC